MQASVAAVAAAAVAATAAWSTTPITMVWPAPAKDVPFKCSRIRRCAKWPKRCFWKIRNTSRISTVRHMAANRTHSQPSHNWKEWRRFWAPIRHRIRRAFAICSVHALRFRCHSQRICPHFHNEMAATKPKIYRKPRVCPIRQKYRNEKCRKSYWNRRQKHAMTQQSHRSTRRRRSHAIHWTQQRPHPVKLAHWKRKTPVHCLVIRCSSAKTKGSRSQRPPMMSSTAATASSTTSIIRRCWPEAVPVKVASSHASPTKISPHTINRFQNIQLTIVRSTIVMRRSRSSSSNNTMSTIAHHRFSRRCAVSTTLNCSNAIRNSNAAALPTIRCPSIWVSSIGCRSTPKSIVYSTRINCQISFCIAKIARRPFTQTVPKTSAA